MSYISTYRKSPLKECIVVGGRFESDIILAKNRDRAYVPEVKIIRDLVNNIERVYMEDLTTGWAEGMNSSGIGIINSSLTVGFDEKEHKIIKKTGKKSEDGKRIIEALSHTDIKDVIKSIIEYDGGVKGHTLVGDQDCIYAIEQTSLHEPFIKRIENGKIVRTNHGYKHTDAGYTEGNNYLSSKYRKAQAEKYIKSTDDVYKILDDLTIQAYDVTSDLNVLRQGSPLFTTSQLGMDLTKLLFVFRPVNCDYLGYEDRTPEDYENKIKVRILKKWKHD